MKIKSALTACFCSMLFIFTVSAYSRGQRAPQTQIRTTKTDPNQGALLSEYLDERTGRTIIVKAGTPQDVAVGWLKRLADTDATKSEQDLTTIVIEGHEQGLIAVSGGFGYTTVVVSWGSAPRRDPPSGTIVSSQMD